MNADINVILVGTQYPSNIGAAARAVANMGANRLILIAPKCELSASKAKQSAAGAQEALAKAETFASWEDFFKTDGGGLRLAFTRRAGKRRTLWPIKKLLHHMRDESPSTLNQPVYLIFGPEDDGLSAEDVAYANHCVSLPTYGDFSSLNLAQAVLMGLFIARDFFEDSSNWNIIQYTPKFPRRQFYFPDETIREWLTTMGFSLEARKASAYLTLRKLLLQNQPTDIELHVLESILQQNIRKLRGEDVEPPKLD